MGRGLPWWRSGWESACRCRGRGFEPWSGKIPHATEQLGPCTTTTEPARLEPVLQNKRGRDSERPVHRDEEWPPLATTRESPRTETKTQHSQKKIFKKLKKSKWVYLHNSVAMDFDLWSTLMSLSFLKSKNIIPCVLQFPPLTQGSLYSLNLRAYPNTCTYPSHCIVNGSLIPCPPAPRNCKCPEDRAFASFTMFP